MSWNAEELRGLAQSLRKQPHTIIPTSLNFTAGTNQTPPSTWQTEECDWPLQKKPLSTSAESVGRALSIQFLALCLVT